jgi:hypothetical protein
VLEDHKLGGSINAINPNAATRNFRNRIRLVRWIPEVSQTPGCPRPGDVRRQIRSANRVVCRCSPGDSKRTRKFEIQSRFFSGCCRLPTTSCLAPDSWSSFGIERLAPIDVIRSSLDQIGKAAGGTRLSALGVMIYGLPRLLDWQIAACVLLKNVAQAVLMALTVIIFRLSWPLSAELILIGALPSETAGAMIAERYEAFQREGPTVILLSTFLSILTVALAIGLVESFTK